MFSNTVPNNTVFNRVITEAFGNSTATKNAILAKYPPPDTKSKFKTQKDRMADYMSKAVFACYTRDLTEAFKGKTYNMQFYHGSGEHGTDLQSVFPSPNGMSPLSLMFGSSKAGPPAFFPQYRSYLTSFVRTGDPNKLRAAGILEWPLVKTGPVFSDVLNVGNDSFSLIKDDENKAEDCDILRRIYMDVTKERGELNCFDSRLENVK
jgi:carboxylesterase type B